MSEQQAQEELQKALINTYLSNLKFLETIDKRLFERINVLSHAIDQGQYTPRYELEFLAEQGEFDIYDTVENKFLYDKKPNKYIKVASSQINLDTKNSISLLEQDLYTDKEINIDIDLFKLQENQDSHDVLVNDVTQYTKVLKQDITSKTNLKEIDKFIFIGTLLGRHFPSIIKKIKAKYYFVIEPNLEIFRLSLFVFDYTLLLSNDANVFFSVMEDPTTLEINLQSFFSLDSWKSHTIKYYSSNYNIKETFASVLNAAMVFSPIMYNYNMMLFNLFRNTTQRINSYSLLSFPLKEKINIFDDKPVLYIAAGPSLKDNINWVKKNKESFFIATVGAAYKKLLENDIIPDIIFNIDSKFKELDTKQFDEESCKKIQKSIIITSINTHSKILSRFNQDRLYLINLHQTLKSNSQPFIGFSVGEIGYRALLELGAKELYLLGTDLAVNQETGDSHHSSNNSSMAQQYNLKNKDDVISKGSFSLRGDLIEVKGNFKEKVLTNRSFNNSIHIYNLISSRIKKPEQNIYNLSNHGAYFEYTTPISVDELENINISISKDEKLQLNSRISALSTKGLTEYEQTNLKNEIYEVQNLLDIIENYEKSSIDSYDDFVTYLIKIRDEIDNIKKRSKLNFYFREIFTNYLSLINMYIDFSFKNIKIKKEDKKIVIIKELWFKKTKFYINSYLKFLEDIK